MGAGVSRMVDLCQEQGVPEPVYQTGNGVVSLVFKKVLSDKNVSQKKMTDRQKLIKQMVQTKSTIPVSTLSEKLGVTCRTIYRDLKIIGISWEGSAKTGHWEIKD